VYGLLALVGLMGFVLNSLFVVVEGFLLRRWPPRASYAQHVDHRLNDRLFNEPTPYARRQQSENERFRQAPT